MSTFSFGAPATSASTTTSTPGFSFGSTSSTGTTGTGGFSFGQPQAQPTSSFSFGGAPSSSTTASSAAPSFSFGTTPTASSTTTTTGTTPSFSFNLGAPAQSTTTPSTTSFSFNPSATATSSVPLTQGFSFSTVQPTSALTQPQQPQQRSVEDILQGFIEQYNEKHPNCRFNHMFYNVVDNLASINSDQLLQGLKQQYPYVADTHWVQAMQKNPDPTRLVPVPARSIDDLHKRVEEQKKRIQAYHAALKNIEANITKMQNHHEAKTLKQIEQLKQKHIELSHRMIKVMKKIEVLRQRGVPIGSADIELQRKLQALQRELNKPNQYRGRLNELIPQLNYYTQYSVPLPTDSMDEENLDAVRKFLERQQEGLTHLIQVLQKDIKDMQYISSQLAEPQQQQQQQYQPYQPYQPYGYYMQ